MGVALVAAVVQQCSICRGSHIDQAKMNLVLEVGDDRSVGKDSITCNIVSTDQRLEVVLI